MFSLGVFPQLNTIIPQKPIVNKPLLFPNQTHLSLSGGDVALLPQIRTVFYASASKIQEKGVMETEDFDDEFEDYDDEGDDIEEDENEELIVPLKNMKRWLENKPSGFGEGKEYDTFIEDKLFEEMEQSRLAQLANLNTLKNNPQQTNSKKLQKHKGRFYSDSRPWPGWVMNIGPSKRMALARAFEKDGVGSKFLGTFEKSGVGSRIYQFPMWELGYPCEPISGRTSILVSEDVPSGIRVRLANLPKKKNIIRDLQLAFKGAPGIVKIVPAVSGNKKTREPVCKGFAFVDFRSPDEANRFVQIYSKESIAFGKVRKQIKCEIVNSSSLDSASQQSVNKTARGPQLAVLSSEKTPGLESYMANRSVDPPVETLSDEYDNEDVIITTWEDTKESLEYLISSEPSIGEQRKESAIDLAPSKQQEKILANGKTLVTKTREKTPKLKLSVSANGEQRKELASNSPSSKKPEKIQANGKRLVSKKKKLTIPGSSTRLKGKEKNVLTDVFSKYGAQKAPLAVQEQS
ncbi:hypothetical protein LguiB_016177 [Lonicera macranthoides]